MPLNDIIGNRFGRLVALEPRVERRNGRNVTKWLCACDCGERPIIWRQTLLNGTAKSCGCLMREVARGVNFKHGHTADRKTSREFAAWSTAKSRCYNVNNTRYKTYGARGIGMCAEWSSNFTQFLVDMGPCPPNGTLDRIDNDADYSPSNCRWATRTEQARNKTTSLTVQWNGAAWLLKDIARATGLTYGALRLRVKYQGQDIHWAVSELTVKMRRLGRLRGSQKTPAATQ